MTDKKQHQHLNGVTLESILNELVAHHGWKKLSKLVEIRCFYNEPSIKSSLNFLRKTPWARTEVERLYCELKELPAKLNKHD